MAQITSTAFEQIKNINQKVKDIVFGYIRLSQCLLPNNNNSYYNIPSLVSYICILYYNQTERFSKYPKNMKHDELKNNIRVISTGRGTVYGDIMIDCSIPSIYEWIIKIIKMNGDDWDDPIIIGIDSSNKQYIDSNFCTGFTTENNRFYGYSTCGLIENYNNYPNEQNRFLRMPIFFDIDGFGQNDIIKLYLNTKNKQLKIYKNDKEMQGEITDIDINEKYYFAVSLSTMGDEIELIDFVYSAL